MSNDRGLICAYLLDGQGGGTALDWAGVEAWRPDEGVLWMHLDRSDFDARRWLRDTSGIDSIIVDSLLAKGSRPRTTVIGQSLLVFLRGINLNPEEDPVHMVSMRMYAEEKRVVTIRRQHLMAVDDVKDSLEGGNGPLDAGDLLIAVAGALTERMRPKLTELKEELEALEEDLENSDYGPVRPRLAGIQRETIELRRYLAPQREALSYLCTTEIPWLTGRERMRLFETIDQIKRYVENLDAGREHAQVLHEQISENLNQKINRNMYLLSIMAAVFLPLDFVTGLLGVNLGGIPGQDNPLGFLELTIGLAFFAVFLLAIFHRLQWLRPLQRSSPAAQEDSAPY
jgi:zinc transporter